MIKISPSVFACDFSRLGEEVLSMQKAGADMIHLDVMDGNFVPTISFGAVVISSLKKVSDIYFDAHLMVSHPLEHIDNFAKAGCDCITFHIESQSDPAQTIAKIRSHGISPGLVLNPETSALLVKPYLKDVDMVLIMSVRPGFGGQSFTPQVLEKARQLRNWEKELGVSFEIEIDGGIDDTTAALAAECGVNVFVAGSSLYSSENYTKAVASLRASAQAAYH